METREGRIHRIKIRCPPFPLDAWECPVPKDAALDHFHHIETRTNDVFVHTQSVHMRNRESRLPQCGDRLRLALNRVSALQDCSWRFAPHNVRATWRQ